MLICNFLFSVFTKPAAENRLPKSLADRKKVVYETSTGVYDSAPS